VEVAQKNTVAHSSIHGHEYSICYLGERPDAPREMRGGNSIPRASARGIAVGLKTVEKLLLFLTVSFCLLTIIGKPQLAE